MSSGEAYQGKVPDDFVFPFCVYHVVRDASLILISEILCQT